MRLGVLFSGGKDSTLALHKAAEKEEVACLITIFSKNKESYMFHTPNIELTALQAEALHLPLIRKVTAGEPEKELKELEKAIAHAITRFKIAGIVTGAVESVYQAARIQQVCNRLDVWCFNPLLAVTTEFSITQVIGQYVKDVRACFLISGRTASGNHKNNHAGCQQND